MASDGRWSASTAGWRFAAAVGSVKRPPELSWDGAASASDANEPTRWSRSRARSVLSGQGAAAQASLPKLVPCVDDDAALVLDAVDLILRREGFLKLQEAPGFARAIRSIPARPTSLLYSFEEHKDSLLPFADAIEASVTQLSGELASSARSMANRNARAGSGPRDDPLAASPAGAGDSGRRVTKVLSGSVRCAADVSRRHGTRALRARPAVLTTSEVAPGSSVVRRPSMRDLPHSKLRDQLTMEAFVL